MPGKNIMDLNGLPLIAHSIVYAKKVMPEVPVYVSTDSEEIAAVAQRYGAEVIDRPVELGGDFVTTAAVTKQVTQQLFTSGLDFDYMILLQATNPLRPDSLLEEATGIIEREQCKSLFTVTKLIKKLGKIKSNKFLPENYYFGQRSQDLEPLFFENGLLYITHRDLLLDEVIFNEQSYPLIVDDIRGEVDIDSIDDFRLAEFYIKNI